MSTRFAPSRPFAPLLPVLLTILILLGLSLGSAPLAQGEGNAEGEGESTSKEYRATIKRFLEVTGSASMGEQISYMMAEQMLASIAAAGIPLTESIRTTVHEEAVAEFQARFSDMEYLTDLHAPIYREHLSEKELKELVAFYETPLGKKTTQVMPQIAQATGMALQQASFARVPEFQHRVQERLEAAGVEIMP